MRRFTSAFLLICTINSRFASAFSSDSPLSSSLGVGSPLDDGLAASDLTFFDEEDKNGSFLEAPLQKQRGTLQGVLCGMGLLSNCPNSSTIDTDNDIENCGRLGYMCPTAFENGIGNVTCLAGNCTTDCAPGYNFSRAAFGCINTYNDTSNCGSIGHACDIRGALNETCVAGVCHAVSCEPGLTPTLNGTACVDILSDVGNCGAVGLICPPSFVNGVGPTICVHGVCEPTSCVSGYDFDPSMSTCRSVTADPYNCGSLGTICSAPGTVSACIDGACVAKSCLPPYVLVNGDCTLTQASGRAAREKRMHEAEKEKREIKLCPGKETACPIEGSESFLEAKKTDFLAFRSPNQWALLQGGGGYECLDTTTSIESCGGCASMGYGTNCLEIAHAFGVECIQGACEVFSCESGYKPNLSMTGCVKWERQAGANKVKRSANTNQTQVTRSSSSPIRYPHSHLHHRH